MVEKMLFFLPPATTCPYSIATVRRRGVGMCSEHGRVWSKIITSFQNECPSARDSPWEHHACVLVCVHKSCRSDLGSSASLMQRMKGCGSSVPVWEKMGQVVGEIVKSQAWQTLPACQQAETGYAKGEMNPLELS